MDEEREKLSRGACSEREGSSVNSRFFRSSFCFGEKGRNLNWRSTKVFLGGIGALMAITGLFAVVLGWLFYLCPDPKGSVVVNGRVDGRVDGRIEIRDAGMTAASFSVLSETQTVTVMSLTSTETLSSSSMSDSTTTSMTTTASSTSTASTISSISATSTGVAKIIQLDGPVLSAQGLVMSDGGTTNASSDLMGIGATSCSVTLMEFEFKDSFGKPFVGMCLVPDPSRCSVLKGWC